MRTPDKRRQGATLHPQRAYRDQLQPGGLASVVHPPEQPEQLTSDRRVRLEPEPLPEPEQPVDVRHEGDAINAGGEPFQLASTNPH